MSKTILIAAFLLIPFSAWAHGTPPVISMTAEGFEPKDVTIEINHTVIFQNKGDKNRWPASNFHPTHTLYPEFDPLQAVEPGHSWSFKFEKAGTWRMHDHLFPHMTGTITVLPDEEAGGSEEVRPENSGFKKFLGDLWHKITDFFRNFFNSFKKTDDVPESSLTKTQVSTFMGLEERQKYEFLEDTALKENPETAWAYVKAGYDTPEGVVGNPHDLAHLVGQLIFDKYGFKGLPICEPLFAFGCYHGLMEKAFDQTGLTKLAEAEQGCLSIAPSDEMSARSCIHGIGHGLATFEEHELAKALPGCENLNAHYQVNCYDGVFMEFMISAPLSFYSSAKPLAPCSEIEEKYRTSCGRSQPQVMRFRMNMDTPSIARACLASDDQSITYHCIDAIGYYVGQQSEGRADSIVANCSAVNNATANAQCIAAAAGEIIFQNYAGWQTAAPKACDSLTTEEFRNLCLERVNNVKQSYGRG